MDTKPIRSLSSRSATAFLPLLLTSVGLAGLSYWLFLRPRSQDLSTHPNTDRERLAQLRYFLDQILLNPGSVSVMVINGALKIRGPLFSDEAEQVRLAVQSLGFQRVVDLLEVHDFAEGVPGLQGHSPGNHEDLFPPEVMDRFPTEDKE